MPLPGHVCNNPKDLLTDLEMDTIHASTLEILGDVGVVFGDDRALEILKSGGCRVEHSTGRVRFPGQLVEECLQLCPSRFSIKARNPAYDLDVGGDRLYFQSHPGLYLSDLETGERREASLQDIGPLVRLIDALDEIHLAIMPTATIAEKHPAVMTEWVTAEQMRNTQKVTAHGAFHGCARWVVEMAAVTEQQVYGQINPVSPLHYPQDQIEGGLDFVSAGHPICILPGPTLGANSPATLAGTLVLQNAEHLAGVVLVQLFRPEAPVTLASYPHVMDMRNGAPCIGGVEVGLLGAALAQIGRRYGIPSHPEFPMTDSKALDEQTAFEKAMSLVLLAEAGANLISNGGALEVEKMWSPVQLVIDNELNGMVARIMDGITVDANTIALDVIKEVGPSGNFLETKHTRRTWRSEQFLPVLADRVGFETWKAQGSRDITHRAQERAMELISTHEVPPLSEHQDKELDRIVKATEREKLTL
ncbi:MAG: trimethylamine methyltransferase family protein [Anaerolineales bacterium]|jgi:trimethylamine--corrinoid protein Co-methyltransferase|nr:trimethylamine methyltransferase family protein [Anaerolineales bacterium]|tara:strand:- start:18491 stop:19918 length:1428 start_codon:yes stop_codon:yes gene_type:complete